MTDDTYANEAREGDATQPATAGSTLRSAREAAGLSVDDVALQLKLAPRQVRALEDDDFQHLPGRTFARGFARNYARFIQLDPDRVLALMPAGESAPALERPSFAAARRPMGEIPVERAAHRSFAPRVLFLLLALVAVGAAAYYAYVHKASEARREAAGVSGAESATTTIPAPQSLTAAGSTTTLPNPVAAESPTTATLASPPTGETATGAAGTPDAAATPAGGGATAAKASDAALVLAFRGTSWAEVKDANGRVILQMTGGAGMTQTVTGTPPLELSLGNAPDVAVTFRGQSLDLAPFTRGVVARVALK